MTIGIRGHDITCEGPVDFCNKLNQLGISSIQLAPHKSFEGFEFSKETVENLASILKENGITVAVYGCYIDPCTTEGVERFLQHIEYAKILNARVIATETGMVSDTEDKSEETYQKVLNAFKQFCAKAENYNVNVAVETVKIFPIDTPETTKRLLNDVGHNNLRVIIDPANLAIGNNKNAISLCEKAIELYGQLITTLHYKDVADIDYKAIMNLLEKLPQGIDLITEEISGERLIEVLKSLA